MSQAAQLLQMLVAIPLLIGVILVLNAPYFLAGWAAEKRDEARRRLARETELERKLAIAEAANAARRRGEAFVPPADYDR
jgi:hypothetical protein